ncbi:MAG: FG-GAP repeat protein, partial [Actinomycetota bacterium]
GYSLGSGDFDGDGSLDVAVGVPHEDIGPVVDAGSAQIVYGSPGGLTTSGDQVLHQDTAGLNDTAEAEDRLAGSIDTE